MKKLFAFKNLIILLLALFITLLGCNTSNNVEHKHSLVFNKGKEATCLEEGIIDSYSCSTCGKVFKDSNANFEVENLVINRAFHSFKNGICEVCDIEEPNKDTFTRIDINGAPTQNGNYLYFGSYPQTDVTLYMAEELSLNVSNLPTNKNRNGFKNYDYKNSTVWYKDVVHTDSEQYRAVYIEKYRKNKDDELNSSQQDNGYHLNEIYWFKFEPIKWRILSENNGEALILSELILDSEPFQSDYIYKEDPNNSWSGFYVADKNGNILIDSNNEKVVANNYEYSSIRSFLNEYFYNTAFNSLQKELIKLVEVDNSYLTTESMSNGFICNNTEDKLFLLSFKDLVNSEYGFNSSSTVNDTNRKKEVTNYAKLQGVSVTENFSSWWLRSSRNGTAYDVQAVNFLGNSNRYSFVNYSNVGVVPALYIKIS